MKKVLYVDDARSMRKLVDQILKEHFDVTFAENGKEGLNAIETQKFDVILSDINMPIMTGLEFLEKLRQHPNGRFTPTLMLTTEASKEMKDEGRRLGATGWIVKPFDPEKLIGAIERVS
ncbi:MAG: two-component system, chemotaxis family, chemotaxis protein CheY [Thiomicrorhabdus sp.]|nr:MAG: two-component system, chemotaxis family, chemotaxis protein CheY [Thiomicrorhabdus sp.]